MPTAAKLTVGCDGAGIVARLHGHGTMRESPCFQRLVTEALVGEPEAVMTVSLFDCDYLDSTFLGCLISLTKKFSLDEPPRFLLAADAEKRKLLFGSTCLDRVMKFADAEPICSGDCVPLETACLESREFAVHAAECHRRLAQAGGPQAAAFDRIAARLESELATRG